MSTVASQFPFENRPIVVVMGVSGCGKSTIGAELARRQILPFMDADDYHPPSNVEKMSAGIALTDEDRWPWLTRLGEVMAEKAGEAGGVVCACSALKRVYRDRLAGTIGLPVLFILLDGTRDLLWERMSARKDHYMPPSLLDSQLATLERPAEDEPALTISIDHPIDVIVDAIEGSFALK